MTSKMIADLEVIDSLDIDAFGTVPDVDRRALQISRIAPCGPSPSYIPQVVFHAFFFPPLVTF